jgi:hypothetical protein
VGVSVDSAAASAALTEKLRLPFPLLSDPDGDAAIRPFGLWDEAESLSRIGVVALEPSGIEIYRFLGADYADRPPTEDVLESVRALRLIPREARAGVHPHVAPEPSADAEPVHDLAVYMRGVRSSSKALYQRTGDEDAGRVWRMAARYYELLKSA